MSVFVSETFDPSLRSQIEMVLSSPPCVRHNCAENAMLYTPACVNVMHDLGVTGYPAGFA